MVWLVLEYCSGDELYNYLIKQGRIDNEKTQKIFAQLVGAVAYVHLQNCVHRDLKLENILLDKHENVGPIPLSLSDSSYFGLFCFSVTRTPVEHLLIMRCPFSCLQVKLCDFGFTREYEKMKLLQTFCGTVCYSAPEMVKGEKYLGQG